MKKILLFVFIFLVSCMPRYSLNAQPVQAQSKSTNTQYPSPTLTPQPTIDYESTVAVAQEQVDIAQATANEAMRVNAMATAEYVRLMNEQIAFTAEVERQEFEIYSWTATAALTTIPLTATQQAILSTQIPAQQALAAAQLTATKHAPTQLVAMVQAENYKTYGKYNYYANIIASVAIFVFVLCIVVWLYSNPITPKVEDPKPELQKETVIKMHTDKGNGSFSLQRMIIPCSPEQLSELAYSIITGEKTYGINHWEGADTLFTRDVIMRVRGWAIINGFAIETADHQLAPTESGIDFFIKWLDTRELPAEYLFEPKPEMLLQPI